MSSQDCPLCGDEHDLGHGGTWPMCDCCTAIEVTQ